jgi:hypothetical protein
MLSVLSQESNTVVISADVVVLTLAGSFGFSQSGDSNGTMELLRLTRS